MAFRLAHYLHKTIGEIEAMPCDQFVEHLAFMRIEPQGEDRADVRTGILASVMQNLWRGKGPAMKPADFIPRFGPKKQESEASLTAKLGLWAQGVNEKVKNG